MDRPTLPDYVDLIAAMFERFWQHSAKSDRGHPLDYAHKLLIVFFLLMQQRRIFAFKAQHRWLDRYPDLRAQLGFTALPARTTRSRRYKALYGIIQAFVAFSGADAAALDEPLTHDDVYTDKSLFKAAGPVWHQADRKADRVPPKLRHLDRDATWSLTVLRPKRVRADNSSTQAGRIRRWAKQGVMLLTPARKWRNGRYARAYHRFLRQRAVARRLRERRSAIEPMFDVLARVLGTTARQKQLPLQGIANVRTCLALTVLTVQIAMIANSIWGLPPRTISELMAALT